MSNAKLINGSKLKFNRVLPHAVSTHPGMINQKERRVLYNIVYNHYRRKGVIVDAGVFLGASTACFYQGIMDKSKKNNLVNNVRPIQSFDRAVVGESWDNVRNNDKWRHFELPEMEIGESYQDVLEEILTPYSDLTDMHFEDIMDVESFEPPVEILFLDILKNSELLKKCAYLFYPKLVKGAFLIHQDFNHPALPYIKVFQEHLSGHFKHIVNVGPSSIYQLKKIITIDDLDNFFYGNISYEDKVNLHQQAINRKNPNKKRKFFLKSSLCNLMIMEGQYEDAQRALSELYQEYNEKNYPDRRIPIFLNKWSGKINWFYTERFLRFWLLASAVWGALIVALFWNYVDKQVSRPNQIQPFEWAITVFEPTSPIVLAMVIAISVPTVSLALGLGARWVYRGLK